MIFSDSPKFSSYDVVYVPHWMGKITFPVSKIDATEYISVNGDYRCTMKATESHGLPYGTYPRLLLVYLTTISRLSKKREIYLNSSQATLLKSLGKCPSGGDKGSASALKKQAKRLFSTTILYEMSQTESWNWFHYPIADEGVMTWERNTCHESWQSHLVLSGRFFNDIQEHSFPIYRKKLIELSASASQMDIYFWLTSRSLTVKSRTLIPWRLLQLQFGNKISKLSHFKYAFKRSFEAVLSLYPGVRFVFVDDGIILWKYAPDVPREFYACG